MSAQQQGETNRTSDHSVGLWVGAIIIGFVFEFFCRLIGYQENPLGLWLEFTPLLGMVIAGFFILAGILRVIANWSNTDVEVAERNSRFSFGVLVLLLGSCMLASSFASHSVIPIFFG